MNYVLNFFPLLMGMPAGGSGASSGGSGQLVTTIITFGLVIVIFYFLIIRPQNKKQKETKRMLAEIKKGDKVVTIGGIRGTVQTVRDETVVVKVDDTTKLEFSKSAISAVVERTPEKKEKKQDSTDNKSTEENTESQESE
ncbi:MAG: preprotein translocase subunit YajC [Spirochaetales bacterium]|nr:preprotein translocase subunit YajC [Spirochaetales bacterium]